MHRRTRMTLPIPALYLPYFDHIILHYFTILVWCASQGYWVNVMLGALCCCRITVVVATYYMHLCFISETPILKFPRVYSKLQQQGVYTNTSRRQNNISQRSVSIHKFAMETLQRTDIFFHARTKACQPIVILSLLLSEAAPRNDADSSVVQ